MGKPDFPDMVDLARFLEVADYFEQAHELEVRSRGGCFCFAHTVYDKCLVTFLFGIEIGDEAGFTVFHGAEYDGAGGVDHMANLGNKGAME